MPTFALQQVSSSFARENAGKTLDKPVALRYLRRFLPAEVFATLSAVCPSGAVYIWGAKLERAHQTEKIAPRDCLVLFRRAKRVFKYGAVVESLYSRPLAEYLWGTDTDGQTWEYVFFLARTHDTNFSTLQLNPGLGRKPNDNWQGFTVIEVPDAPAFQELMRESGAAA
jgi:hypothetical protein